MGLQQFENVALQFKIKIIQHCMQQKYNKFNNSLILTFILIPKLVYLHKISNRQIIYNELFVNFRIFFWFLSF